MSDPQLTIPLNTQELSYYQQRMDLLGIKEEFNSIDIWHGTTFDSEHKGNNTLKPVPIFRETEKGIDIFCYTLQRHKIRTYKDAQRNGLTIKSVDKDYCVTRLYPEVVKKDGSIQKYSMPKGHPTVPFFPPSLVKKFEERTVIPVLYITEGYFKAFKACMHGIDCVGLPSITCMREQETGELHRDIIQLIDVCSVERVVWLTDGDCRNITTKDIKDGIDLYKRPKNFFNTISTFYELLSKQEQVQKYFAHINTDDLAQSEGGRVIKEGPKGLDDLLCELQEQAADIAGEFRDFSRLDRGGIFKGSYLVRINISFNLISINRYFFLHDVDLFYQFHSERRPDLKQAKNFKFNGTLYSYDEGEGKCKIEIPSSAADYFRVDDDYYQFIMVPDRFGKPKLQYHRRSKSTITDDHTKTIIPHIPKYATFCVVPDHTNYQRVINNCFNKYQPFIHEPEEGDCQLTLDFIKHIFGEEPVPYKNADGSAGTISRYELGLDYITLLYKRPQQILPILCLTSVERQTGKTKFAEWLNAIFAGNMAIVGNEDLANQFNSHWADKLIICCDETKIDKVVVLEKVKSLSTGSEVMMNAKGRDQISMQFFGKFIFLTNNEDNFINIDSQEIRFWIISVPTVQRRNVNLVEEMIEEIPAFLNFLNKRQMLTTYKERHWFDTQLLQTEALRKIKANSKPTLEKRIHAEIAELFSHIGQDVITIPTRGLTDVLKNVDKNYLLKTLRNMGYEQSPAGRGKYPVLKEGLMNAMIGETAERGLVIDWVGFNTTFYEFKRENFTAVPGTIVNNGDAPGITKDDLPF